MLDMPDSGNSRPMSSMPPETRKDLLILSEEQIRTDGPVLDFERLGSYWQDLLLVLSWHKAYRLEDSEMQQRAKDCISEPAYRDLLTNWVTPMTLAGSN